MQAAEIDELVEKKFEGSLPAFITAFTKHQQISDKEIDEVQKMIDRYRKRGIAMIDIFLKFINMSISASWLVLVVVILRLLLKRHQNG